MGETLDFHTWVELPDDYDSDWHEQIRSNWSDAETRLMKSGSLSARPATAPDGALYLITDSGDERVTQYDGTNNQWVDVVNDPDADSHDHSGDQLNPSSVKTSGNVELESGNVQLTGTDQSITDGSNDRIQIKSNLTDINDEDGNVTFRARNGVNNRLYTRSGTPIQVYDSPHSQTAVEYSTGNPGTTHFKNSVVGILRTPSGAAVLDVEAKDSNNDFLRISNQDSATSTTTGQQPGELIWSGQGWDSANSTTEELNYGIGMSITDDTGYYGYVSIEDTGGTRNDALRWHQDQTVEVVQSDLQMSTGQGITDGTNNRILFRSDQTRYYDQSGRFVLIANNANETNLYAYSDQPVQIKDQQGNHDAVKLLTDGTTSTLELTNANADLSGNHITNADVIEASGNGNRLRLNRVGQIEVRPENDSGNRVQALRIPDGTDAGTVDIPNGDLQMANNSSITDGASKRFEFFGSGSNDQTRIYDGTETKKISASTSQLRLWAYSGEDVHIYDNEGGFTAVQYATDTSSGTLELTNSDVDMAGNILYNAGHLSINNRNVSTTATPTGELRFAVDDGSESGEGDLYAIYDDGSTTKKIQITDFSAGSTA